MLSDWNVFLAPAVIAAAIALLGGLRGRSTVNLVALRKKTKAEVTHLNAMAAKATAETQKIASELSAVKTVQENQGIKLLELNTFKEDILERLVAFSMSGFTCGH